MLIFALFTLSYLQACCGDCFLAHSHFSSNERDVEDFLHDHNGGLDSFSFMRETDNFEVLHFADEAETDARLQYIFIIVAKSSGTSLSDMFDETCRRELAVLAEYVVLRMVSSQVVCVSL